MMSFWSHRQRRIKIKKAMKQHLSQPLKMVGGVVFCRRRLQEMMRTIPVMTSCTRGGRYPREGLRVI